LRCRAGLALGGLAPFVVGIIGVWSYVVHGYVTMRNGEQDSSIVGALVSILFMLVGLAMILLGLCAWHALRRITAPGRRTVRS
jgi:hypothetical protein